MSAAAMNKILLALIFLTSLCVQATAQPKQDTAFVSLGQRNAVELYRKALGPQSPIYNGSRYAAPKQTFEQHPYFFSEDWLTGTVRYDGESFSEVPLMFDLLSDAVITEHLPSGHSIQLVPGKLEKFSIAGHSFEKIINDSVSNSLPRTGFYDVLYAGNTKVIASRQKFLREKIEVRVITVTYEERNRYFMFKDGIFFPVRSKGSVLKLLDNRRQELKRFLKREKIIFSDNRELALKRLAEHYDNVK